jgi:hypothetical protein
MHKTIPLLAAAGLLLSACGTLYTASRDFRLPGGLAKYDITATMNVGLFFSTASIAVNGRQVLQGESAFLSDTVAMAGSVDGLPIEALCNRSDRKCDVSIAGLHVGVLSF